MAIQIPSRLAITLPRLSVGELTRLCRMIEKKLPDDLFSRRVRLMLVNEACRRESEEPIEPTMEVLAITSGKELAQALSAVRIIAGWKTPPAVKQFTNEVTRHVYAMAESALEVLDKEVRQLSALRASKRHSELLLPSEVATLLGKSEATLKRLVDAGSVPAPIRIGNRRYWQESVIENFLNQQAEESAGE